MVPDDADDTFAFLIDSVALNHPDHPILVVNLYDYVRALTSKAKGRSTVTAVDSTVISREYASNGHK
jgi:hypothetical protein